jgi:amino acid efflux transporter
VIAVLALIALCASVIAGVGPRPLVLLTTGSFVTVYALGTAAALRLLPKRSGARRCACVALVAVAALFAATGWYLLWPLAITGCALLYLHVRERVDANVARVSRSDISQSVKIR